MNEEAHGRLDLRCDVETGMTTVTCKCGASEVFSNWSDVAHKWWLAHRTDATTKRQAGNGERLRVTDGVVAIYRPDRGSPGWPPIRNPWHCYNTYDGSFIECRTDEDVAKYRELPAAPSSGVTEGKAGSGECPCVKYGLADVQAWWMRDGATFTCQCGSRWRYTNRPEPWGDHVYSWVPQPPAPADDAAEVLAGLFGPEEIDDAARALCTEWVETQLKEPVRKFCEYDQLTTEGRDVWRRMARRAISAAQQRLADRGQSDMADEFEPYLVEAMKRPGFRAAHEAALRDEENTDG